MSAQKNDIPILCESKKHTAGRLYIKGEERERASETGTRLNSCHECGYSMDDFIGTQMMQACAWLLLLDFGLLDVTL